MISKFLLNLLEYIVRIFNFDSIKNRKKWDKETIIETPCSFVKDLIASSSRQLWPLLYENAFGCPTKGYADRSRTRCDR